MNKIKQPNIYTYIDFRAYLLDYFTYRCQIMKNYSHRIMAKELGFPSPNYIKLVMDGQRNVGLRSIDRLMRGLQLNDKEQEFFSNLVFFSQAKTNIGKNYYYGLMSSIRNPLNTASITTGAYRYYNEWYHCVVRELTTREKPPVNAATIAKKIKPRITATQVKKSIDLLLELGFIVANEDGTYSQSSRVLPTEHEVVSVGIRNYQLKMIDIAKECIDSVPQDKREISSTTLSISADAMTRIKKRIQEFENELFQIARESQNPKHVYQANFQFFPLTDEELT
ncbi:MAG TPA: TIGR02147 family protein [Chitinispirillaceae bacterium]|nr:TIGR02147 family protein [Chitinispirillaceae bacterium]